jgi:NAD(P)-dependent dehydrogenase (short-subunit alcohol dehydrogenase family)
MPTTNILIIGATRGLGASLANAYASQKDTTVYGTTRSAEAPKGGNASIVWVKGIDVSEKDVGRVLVDQLGALGSVKEFDVVVCFQFSYFSFLRGKRMGMGRATG